MASITYNNQRISVGKIVCIGRNYVEHIQELGNDIPEDMVVFNKPASAISDTLLSYSDEPIHYETELCFLIQNNRLSGVGIGLDLTKRELQSKLKAKGLPWERAKAFDGAAIFTDFVPIPETIDDLFFTLLIDDQLVQVGYPTLMMYSPQIIIEELTKFMRLEDNDILMTGTPKGVGVVQSGAQYTVRLFNKDTQLIEHSWIGE